MTKLPTDSQTRKNIPIASGVLDYFPDAIAAIAEVSWLGNEKHNPGEPLHWAREKSADHPDCVMRHFLERGKLDDDGQRHSAKAAWRMLALLQLEIEADERLGQVFAAPANGGWIKWKATRKNKSPVASDIRVAVEFRDGTTCDEMAAGEWDWSTSQGAGTITAYRVIKRP